MAGTLILIGGAEDRSPQGERIILREFAQRLQGAKVVIATVASHKPEGYFEEYSSAFADLGLGEMMELYIEERSRAGDRDKMAMLDDAAGVFLTGGDQLRVTATIGDTAIEAKIRALFERGGVVAGTAGGAAVLGETMLVKGTSRETHRLGDLHMAPGLGLISNVVIDQHFTERGRMGRLLGVLAHNPRVLGLGIDEDTAAIVRGNTLKVVGSGGVYALDANQVTGSNVADAPVSQALSLHGIDMHLLAAGDGFSLDTRQPTSGDSVPAVETALMAKPDKIRASDWTGRPTQKERTRVVLALAPAAIKGIESLILEYEGRLHNAPPEAVDPEVLNVLRELHTALGSLIQVAESGQPLEGLIDRLRDRAADCFQFLGDVSQLSLMGAKPVLACLPVAWGTWALLNAICAPVTLSTLGPAMVASVATGYFGLAQGQGKRRTRPGRKG